MKPRKQRPNECTLASLCIINDLSQEDYLAVSNLCKEAGVKWRCHSEAALQTRRIALRICEELGLVIPKDYCILDRSVGDRDRSCEFRGKGIVHVSWIPFRCRTPRGHALAFDNGKIIDTDGTVYDGWEGLVADYTRAKRRDIKCNNIFRL